MSLLPPNPIVHSKCYYFLKNSLPQSLFEDVIKQLPKFPLFRLKVVFRNLETVETFEYPNDEIIVFISGTEEYSKKNLWPCSDIAMNMFTRIKKPVQERLSDEKKKGVISYYVQVSYDEGVTFNDMMCDDFLLTNSQK